MPSTPFSFAPRQRRVRRPCSAALALGLAAALGACSGDKDKAPPDLPAEQLYSDGQNLMADGDFKGAAKSFEEVERQHPYSQWATRGQIMAAYSYYESNQYEDAVAAAERFIELHPGHKDVAYAYYLIGISYYEQISDVG